MTDYLYTSGGFPASPSSGDSLVINGLFYDWTGTAWKVRSTVSNRVEFTATANQATKTGLTYFVGSIDCYINGAKMLLGTDFTATDGVTVTFTPALDLDDEVQLILGVNASATSGGSSIVTYANLAAFPATHTASSMGYATDTNSAYMSDGTNWKRMSIGSQIGPQFATPPPTTHKLDPTGATTSISTVAVDESGFPVTYDWDALSGSTVYSASSLPPQLTAVSESSGTFTLTASTNASHKGTIAFRIKASDGVLSTPSNCAVTLSFKEFYGMFFSVGTDGQNILLGDGLSTTLTSITNVSSAALAGTSGFVHRDANRDIFFYRYYSGTLYKHDVSGTLLSSFAFGGSAVYQVCTDGTYAYASGGTTNGLIYRKHLTTLVDSNITQAFIDQPAGNMGAWIVYHDNHIYSKSYGSSNYIHQFNITTNVKTVITDAAFTTGNYSDGGCVVTNSAGVSFIVEVGTGGGYCFNLTTQTLVSIAAASGSSTEYGNGAGEIAEGVALIFGEQTDRATLVDTNTNTPTVTIYTGANNPYSVNHSFGNSFGFAAGIV